MQLPEVTFLQNDLRDWLIAIAVAVGSMLLLALLRRVVGWRLAKMAERSKSQFDDDLVNVLSHTRGPFLFLLSLYLGLHFVDLPTNMESIADSTVIVVLIIQAGLWTGAMLKLALGRYGEKQLAENPASVTTLSAINFVSRLLLWSVVLLLALDNLGIDVTALLTGLGIGGIAVALAVQNILGDLLAALAIVLDKPFAVGDFIVVGDFVGSVEKVGLKTTRLRSLSGEQLIFSNADLLGSRVRNYGRMYERRVVFPLGVTYQTPRSKLELIPKILRETVEAQGEQVRFDRSHFKGYGDFSLNFETVFYVLAADYGLYMDIQQAINLTIHKRFEEEGIEFAYPTQTLFVEGMAKAN
jgi:small-conductance mechanosensitive channel